MQIEVLQDNNCTFIYYDNRYVNNAMPSNLILQYKHVKDMRCLQKCVSSGGEGSLGVSTQTQPLIGWKHINNLGDAGGVGMLHKPDSLRVDTAAQDI